MMHGLSMYVLQPSVVRIGRVNQRLCDGSLFPISQATDLSQDREPSILSARENKTDRKRGGTTAMESLGTNKKKEALSSWVLHFTFQL